MKITKKYNIQLHLSDKGKINAYYLGRIGKQIEAGITSDDIIDINGNIVGAYMITEE